MADTRPLGSTQTTENEEKKQVKEEKKCYSPNNSFFKL